MTQEWLDKCNNLLSASIDDIARTTKSDGYLDKAERAAIALLREGKVLYASIGDMHSAFKKRGYMRVLRGDTMELYNSVQGIYLKPNVIKDMFSAERVFVGAMPRPVHEFILAGAPGDPEWPCWISN